MDNKVRVRFAPSPTGIMHLGNVRTALLNYLFAQQKNGTFVLRIEDTDPERNYDPDAQQIRADLEWLGLIYTEGGKLGGPFAPYYQSQRTEMYQKHLDILKDKGAIYRCFCSTEELERKRARAVALKIAPRYDRTCANLTESQIQEKIKSNILFIWRFKIPDNYIATVNDLAHGNIDFNLDHFSDFPLSRSDGSFTFIFSNCVDDMLMQITHVLRGEDHLSNTANQVALYQTFGAKVPLFWHLPILCNVDGKKLSKRDFGFSLNDLKNSGFLPEAINNYLAIIGGSFTQEIMTMQELIDSAHFDSIKPVSAIKYDVEKLRWVNHKWIQNYSTENLTDLLLPLLQKAYPTIADIPMSKVHELIELLKPELVTLHDIVPLMNFYFNEPTLTLEMIYEHVPEALRPILLDAFKNAIEKSTTAEFFQTLKDHAKNAQIPNKLLFMIVRFILTGSLQGISVNDLLTILDYPEIQRRIIKTMSA